MLENFYTYVLKTMTKNEHTVRSFIDLHVRIIREILRYSRYHRPERAENRERKIENIAGEEIFVPFRNVNLKQTSWHLRIPTLSQ